MDNKGNKIEIIPGNPAPLGVTSEGECYNFAVFLPQADQCEIHIYHVGEKEAAGLLPLPFLQHGKYGFHIDLPAEEKLQSYSTRPQK